MSGALPDYRPSGDVAADKATWRTAVRAARRGLVDGWSEQERDTATRALAEAGLEHLRRYAVAHGRDGLAGATVTAYEPMRTEPPVRGLTDALRQAGVRVLVPVTLQRPRLDWVDLDDPGRVRLGEGVLREVDLAFVPGLAASRAGVRLGQGGGYYDTVLPRLRRLSGGAPVVLVLHDHEVVPQVPAAGHDAVVDAVLRPATGVLRLPLP
ncbi:5-formyltetrahydrofolate cyclo-ligase [uncultured Serinicoccus sp.]|uniref:5-formyltetrahydrofolate cyclo-ligase n=1 Tax=uncultured Serinicoccus sp. TaxID=735514 RepID=UPI002623899F|nr:5-formyltetrahydrofolate cyclo-ligase [uncultured Serinicoccus sp.]